MPSMGGMRLVPVVGIVHASSSERRDGDWGCRWTTMILVQIIDNDDKDINSNNNGMIMADQSNDAYMHTINGKIIIL